MMTQDELDEHASWILKELQRYANEYNHGSEPLWERIALISAELKRRSEAETLDSGRGSVVDSPQEVESKEKNGSSNS